MGPSKVDDGNRKSNINMLVNLVLLLASSYTLKESLVLAQAVAVEVTPALDYTSTHLRAGWKSSGTFRLANASTDPLSVFSIQVGSQYESKVGLSVAVGHVDSPNSPLRPQQCSAGDEGCVLHHRITRHLTARRLEQTIRAPVYGQFEGGRALGDYYVQVAIGKPSKTRQILLLDTASDLLWVQAFPCKRCFDQKQTPQFFPLRSPSNTNLGCNDRPCRVLEQSGRGSISYHGCGPFSCSFEKTYTRGRGAFVAGDLASEAFTFGTGVGGAAATFVLLGVVYGKVFDSVFPVPPIGFSGILGLGGGNGGSQFSFATQVSGNFGNQFSFCLPSAATQGTSTLDFGPDSMPSPAVGAYYMPLKAGGNPNFYYVGLRSIFVGGSEVAGISSDTFRIRSNSEGGVIVDTATPYTVLTSPAYDAFQEAFVNAAERIGLGTVYRTGLPQYYDLFDTCWDITGKEASRPLIPEVKFAFEDGGYLIFGYRSLVVQITDNKNSSLCLAILRAKDSVNAIGNFQLQNLRLAFDLRNNKLGWFPNAC